MNGTCEHTPKESFDAVSCRLDAMHELISTAPSGAIRSAAIRQRVLAKLGKLSALVAKGRAGGARGGKALRRADRGAAALASLIQKLAARGKIAPGLGARLGTLASSLKPSIDRITTP